MNIEQLGTLLEWENYFKNKETKYQKTDRSLVLEIADINKNQFCAIDGTLEIYSTDSGLEALLQIGSKDPIKETNIQKAFNQFTEAILANSLN